MSSSRRERSGKPRLPDPVRVEAADPKEPLSQTLLGELLGPDYPRLLIALHEATLGDLFFVQLNSPVQRRRLPEQLAADGLQRPFAVADFATFQPGPPPHGILREFLEELKPTSPEILFVNGLEHWIDADPQTLEALNLGREQLANLGVVVVFLLPAYLIDLIRARALNLWSWRAHHYSLEPGDTTEHDGRLQFLDTGHSISPGDTPEARERRIRILQRLLDEGLIENRTLDSLTHSILLPLVCELYDAGRFPEALALLDQVKGIPEKIGDSLDGAAILNMRALMLEALHYFDKAEPLYQGALAIAVKILGPEHPYVATILNNLGALYYDQRKYAEAEALYRRSLAIRERVLGQNHSGVASSLNNLAVLYETQGSYAEAIAFYKQALTILEQVLGLEHPDVATSLNNLAGLYRILGNYTEAERCYQQALTVWEKALGPNHPNVAQCLENYAVVLRKTNREAEAEKLETRAQAIRAKHAQQNPTDRNV